MIPLLDVSELEARLPKDTLPLNEEGELDSERITLALQEATGIIVTHLPWLLDGEEIGQPIPAQFKDTLLGICTDLALYRLTDKVSSSEDDEKRYESKLKLLEKIDREYKGGLSGPDYQEASLVTPDKAAGINDNRFWKKEGLY